jgi:hypothetical protein
MINKLLKKFRVKKHDLADVFTPSTSAKLTFVERNDLDDQINRALIMPGMQLIVYGHSGSGKTTITQNILVGKQTPFIVSNCILDTTVNDIILDAFDKLNPYYTSEKETKVKAKISAELKASYAALDTTIKSELSSELSEKKQRALPIQLTAQRLAEFLGAAGVVWIIEDFHKVAKSERQKLSQILKIFVDVSNKYRTVKVIAIGAVDTAREVVNYDSELNNRISEIHVPLLTKEELEGIINKGEKLLNIYFDPKIHEEVIHFSNSLAAICHHLCFSICWNNSVERTLRIKKKLKTAALLDAVRDYLKQNSDSFKETLDRALKPRAGKFDKTKKILQCFCDADKHELTHRELLSVKGNKKTYGSQLEEYLRLLTTADYGEILRFDDNSGKYSFSNPFFKAYTIMYFSIEERDQSIHTIDLDIDEIMKYFNITIDNVKLKVERVAPKSDE